MKCSYIVQFIWYLLSDILTLHIVSQISPLKTAATARYYSYR